MSSRDRMLQYRRAMLLSSALRGGSVGRLPHDGDGKKGLVEMKLAASSWLSRGHDWLGKEKESFLRFADTPSSRITYSDSQEYDGQEFLPFEGGGHAHPTKNQELIYQWDHRGGYHPFRVVSDAEWTAALQGDEALREFLLAQRALAQV